MLTFLLLFRLTASQVAVLVSEYSTDIPDAVLFNSVLDLELLPHTRILVDLTESITSSLALANYASAHELVHIIPSPHYDVRGPNTYNMFIPGSQEAEAVLALVASFSLHEYIAVYCIEDLNEHQQVVLNAAWVLGLECSESPDLFAKKLGRAVKNRVETCIVLIAEGSHASCVLAAADYADMSNGYQWVLLPPADYLDYAGTSSLETTGVLALAAFPYLLSEKLELIEEAWRSCARSVTFVACVSSELGFTENHTLPPTYALINVQNFTMVQVGEVSSEEVVVTDFILWPGNATEREPRGILISLDTGIIDPSGSSNDFLEPAYQGVRLAVSYINKQNELLEFFNLETTETNFGAVYFDYEFAQTELSTVPLGAALVAPAVSDVVLGLSSLLVDTGTVVPMMGYSNTVEVLSSIEEFPMYLRVCVPDSYQASLLVTILEFFAWDQVGVIYLNNSYSLGLYTAFEQQATAQHIEVIAEALLPGNSEGWTHAELDSGLSKVGRSDARILIVFCFTDEVTRILVRMHELGFAGPEYEYIATAWLVDELLNQDEGSPTYNATELAIVRAALHGSLMLFPVSFVGEFGETVSTLFTETYGAEPVGYSAFGFDAVMSLAHAFDYLLVSGEDYNDPETLMNAVRKVNFIGTTGTVSFAGNDRYLVDHVILNAQESAGVWTIKTVGLYSPTNSKILELFEPVQWADGTHSVPSDSPPRYKCAYGKEPVVAVFGAVLLGGLTLIVMCVTISMSITVMKRWPAGQLELPTERESLSFPDILLLLQLPADFVQLLNVIPPVKCIQGIYETLSVWLSVDILHLYLQTGSQFWTLWQVAAGSAAVAILCRGLRLCIQVPGGKTLVRVVTDLCFLSVLGVLISVHVCLEASSQDGLEVVVHNDCSEWCFSKAHLAYMSGGTFLIIGYLILTLLDRYFNLTAVDSNLQVKPQYSLYRTGLQVLVICVRKNLVLLPAVYFNAAYAVLLILSIFLVAKWSPYNVRALNAASATSYALVLLAIGLGSLGVPPWVLISSWAAILVGITVWGRLAKWSWPYSSDSEERFEMYKFAFSHWKKIVPPHGNLSGPTVPTTASPQKS